MELAASEIPRCFREVVESGDRLLISAHAKLSTSQLLCSVTEDVEPHYGRYYHELK